MWGSLVFRRSSGTGGSSSLLGDLFILLDDHVLFRRAAVGFRGEFVERLCAAEDEVAYVVGYVALNDDFVYAWMLNALADGCACSKAGR